MSSEKVPTKLRYEADGEVKWGFEIKPDEEHFHEFKLGLSSIKTTDSDVAKKYRDPAGKMPTTEHQVIKCATDYLRKLKEHTIQVLTVKLGEAVMERTEILWILTVPAIWDEGAKQKTRDCARNAGFVGDIVLVLEPEAAMTYAIETKPPESLESGQTFVMCDAGGGTVDLITYIIAETTPLVTNELVKGKGDRCGSAYLNRAFHDYFVGKVQDHDGYGEDTWLEALKRFEEEHKRIWDGTQQRILVPASGLVSDSAKGINRGKLVVPGQDMNGVFDEIISNIIPMIQAQIHKTPSRTVDYVLLVGGFGQSPYLRKKIQEAVNAGVEVLQPPKGWTAFVSGALMHGLRLHSPSSVRVRIGSRKARMSYGCTATVNWKRHTHNPTYRQVPLSSVTNETYVSSFMCAYHGVYRVEIVDWFMKKV